MRIIAGQWRGQTIEAPPGAATRPTADRVRETLFSMLVSRIGSFDDLRIADLFAGSGALGFEALSRGAAHATFVEQDTRALAAIRRNADKLGAAPDVRTAGGSAFLLAPTDQPFDVVFADPPYAPGSGSAALAAIVAGGWLGSGGWAAIETARGDPVTGDSMIVEVERDVGAARLTLLSRRA